MVQDDDVPVATTASQLLMSRRSAARFLHYFKETGGPVHYESVTWNRPLEDNDQHNDAMKQAVLRRRRNRRSCSWM